MKKILVSDEIIQEAKNITDKVYAPVRGFMNQEETDSVLNKMRLKSGEIWSMPVTLDISRDEFSKIKKEKDLVITNNRESFILSDVSFSKINKNVFSQGLFGTLDKKHPGVKRVRKMKDYFVGGLVESSSSSKSPGFLYSSPEKVKEIFRKNGWSYVVAFQTRNPPHRSHEYLQEEALKNMDAIFINPIIGSKKKGDFRDEYIIGAYKKLIKNYHPSKNFHLGTFHTFMRYAGPKEAVFHALVRRNFGCSHMIIGRDHAGIGDYYGSYDAQEIFNRFSEKELGIKILKFENVIFCKSCKKNVFERECKHSLSEKISFSGTEIREKILKGEKINANIMRKEIVEYLLDNKNNLFVK